MAPKFVFGNMAGRVGWLQPPGYSLSRIAQVSDGFHRVPGIFNTIIALHFPFLDFVLRLGYLGATVPGTHVKFFHRHGTPRAAEMHQQMVLVIHGRATACLFNSLKSSLIENESIYA